MLELRSAVERGADDGRLGSRLMAHPPRTSFILFFIPAEFRFVTHLVPDTKYDKYERFWQCVIYTDLYSGAVTLARQAELKHVIPIPNACIYSGAGTVARPTLSRSSLRHV